MSTLKRCCGYRSHWECADDYPDHMVPIGEFGISSRDGLQPTCNRCRNFYNQLHSKRISIAEQLVGGRKPWRSMAQEGRSKVFIEVDKAEILNFQRPPKDDLPAAKPARKRTNLEPLDKLPPEGWVYIIAASRHASIMKIGSTFEYGVRDRLSEAKRWALAGSAVLLHKEWFSKCKQAESLVHKRLDYYRIVSPDAGDELFRTSFEHALANVMIIKNEVENDRKEQAMG